MIPRYESRPVSVVVIDRSIGSELGAETNSRGLKQRTLLPSFLPATYSIMAEKEGSRSLEKTGSEPTSGRSSFSGGVEWSMNPRNIVIPIMDAVVVAAWKGSQRLALSRHKFRCILH